MLTCRVCGDVRFSTSSCILLEHISRALNAEHQCLKVSPDEALQSMQLHCQCSREGTQQRRVWNPAAQTSLLAPQASTAVKCECTSRWKSTPHVLAVLEKHRSHEGGQLLLARKLPPQQWFKGKHHSEDQLGKLTLYVTHAFAQLIDLS